ncbi:hypothetical protein DXG03_000477 [Asterophora parasitica]|uniref:Uncharacterized protein n=1 Tax=Asterophora parasitica TaxID=117018 RepID=A0A9P7GCL8_9AGAR|nr:hypothetical protein DXG03_000477 [Asterophora parasitica]
MIIKSSTSSTPAVDSNDEPSPPPYEGHDAWPQSVHHLQQQIEDYHETEEQGREPTEAQAQQVVDAMRGVGDTHPNPNVRRDWYQRADTFSRATRSVRRWAVRESRGVIGTLLHIPIAVVGLAFRIVGGVLHAAGSILEGLGGAPPGDRDARSVGYGAGRDPRLGIRDGPGYYSGRRNRGLVGVLVGEVSNAIQSSRDKSAASAVVTPFEEGSSNGVAQNSRDGSDELSGDAKGKRKARD